MGLDTLEEAVDEYIDSKLAQWKQEFMTAIVVRLDHSKAIGYLRMADC